MKYGKHGLPDHNASGSDLEIPIDRSPAVAGRGRVIIVESDRATAWSIAILLENVGYRIVAIVRSLADLAARVGTRPVDADIAIVDHSGSDEMVLRAAELLRNSNVPFVWVCRHPESNALPAPLAEAPGLGFFAWTADVLRLVASTLGRRAPVAWNEGEQSLSET